MTGLIFLPKALSSDWLVGHLIIFRDRFANHVERRRLAFMRDPKKDEDNEHRVLDLNRGRRRDAAHCYRHTARDRVDGCCFDRRLARVITDETSCLALGSYRGTPFPSKVS